MVLWRLARSKVYLTHDPAEADVFFVPILTRPKLQPDWAVKCRALSDALARGELDGHLPHLNQDTAHRHFVIFSQDHNLAEARNCSGWVWRQGYLHGLGLVA